MGHRWATDTPNSAANRPGPAAAVQRVGDQTRARGDLASAVTIYRRVADLVPSNPPSYLAMGDTLLALGAYNDATKAYHDAIDRGATVDAYRGLGNALIAQDQDQPGLALTRFEQAIRLAEDDVRGYSGKGVAKPLARQVPPPGAPVEFKAANMIEASSV